MNPKNTNLPTKASLKDMAEDVKSFGDLKTTLIKAKPPKAAAQAPSRASPSATPRAAPMPPAAQERGRARLDQAGPGKITVNGRDEKSISRVRCCA
jgi:small subunit ribosomal protein S9